MNPSSGVDPGRVESDRAELHTLRSQLEEIIARVVAVGDRYRDTEDSLVSGDLDGTERNLVAARRTLERALATFDRMR